MLARLRSAAVQRQVGQQRLPLSAADGDFPAVRGQPELAQEMQVERHPYPVRSASRSDADAWRF